MTKTDLDHNTQKAVTAMQQAVQAHGPAMVNIVVMRVLRRMTPWDAHTAVEPLYENIVARMDPARRVELAKRAVAQQPAV